MSWVVYHNPKCSKCRRTLELLSENGIEPRIVHYLEGTVEKSEIQHILDLLKIEASQLVRKKENLYEDLKLDGQDEEAHLEAMVNHPKLMERPVVVCGDKAVLGRPPENILDLFK